MRLLLDYGADPNHVTESFPTPILYSALVISHSKIVNLLLNNGATVDYDHDNVRITISEQKKTNTTYQLMGYTALCNVLNKKNGIINFDENKLNGVSLKLYLRCKKELESIKKMYIHGSVSLFKVLSEKDIGPYARNQDVIKAFETKCTCKRFPIYGLQLRKRFFKEMKKQQLRKNAMQNFSRILKWNENSLRLVFDNIFRFLNEKDYRTLVAI